MEKLSKESLIRKISRLEKRIASYRNKLGEARSEIQNLLKRIRQHELILQEFPGWLILVQNDKILLANKKALEELGYDEGEVLGKPFEEFIHQDSLDYVVKVHRKRLMGEIVPKTYDLYLLSKSGQSIPCEARVGKIRYQGRKAFLVSLTPLQQRKEAEQRRIEEEKQRIIYSLSLGVSKELQTSLNLLNNCLHRPDIQTISHKKFFKQLLGVQKRHEELIDLLKLLEDKQETEKSVVGLPVLIGEALEAAKQISALPVGADASVDFETFIRASSLVKVNAHELKTAITHVISNAIEACLPDGKVLITLEETPGFAHIYVQDNGLGISPKDQGKIFEPFFTTKNDHLGLGLTVASAILRRYGGKIELTSRPGHGTFFSLTIPTARGAPKAKIPPPGKALKHKHVMILGEGDAVIELISELLSDKGAMIIIPSNLDKALKLLTKRTVDLVIADLTDSTLRLVGFLEKALETLPGLPILCITAHGQTAMRTEPICSARLNERIIFVQRPVNMADLLDTVTRQLTFGPET